MNSGLIGIETLRFQLRATVLIGFFQLLECVQQDVGLFALPVIVKQLVAQFAVEGLYGWKTEIVPDTFKGRLPTIEKIETELGGRRG